MSDQLNSLVESSAESLKELRRLTAADIAASDTLQRMGAAEGDAVDMGNQQLVRNVSDEPKGQVITQSDISNSKTLQDLGAEIGDVIVDNKLVKAKDDSLWRAIEYGFQSNTNTTGTILDYVRSELPIDTYGFETEVYNEGDTWQSIEPEQRREIIANERLEDLQQEFADYTPDGGVGELIGGFGKQLLDPLNLTIAGRGVGGAFATGFGLGATDSVARQAFNNQEIDAGAAAAQGVVEGALGAGIVKGVKMFQNRKSALTKKQRVMQEAIDMKLGQGSTAEEAFKAVKDDFKVSDAELAKLVSKTGEKFRMRLSNKKHTERNIDYALKHDTAASAQQSGAVGRLLGAINSELDKIAPAMAARVRKLEGETHVKTAQDLEINDPLFKNADLMGAKGSSTREEFSRRLFSRDFDGARDMINRLAPDLREPFENSLKYLERNYDELVKAGYKDLEKIDNYWPRKIKDAKGLAKAIGKNGESEVDKIKSVIASKANKSVADLDDVEVGEAFDKYLRGFRANKSIDGYVLGSTQDRAIDIIPERYMEFYYDAFESLARHVRESATDIKKREFFGRNVKNDGNGSVDGVGSIGQMMAEDIRKGNMLAENAKSARELLEARFIGGERNSSGLVKGMRELGYLSTIANPLSALTQLTDLTTSVMRNGLADTVSAALKGVVGKSKVKQVDIGINDASKELAELMENDSALTKVLDKAFTFSGFAKADKFMKETFINSSLTRLQKDVRNPKALAKLSKQYAPIFRNEWPSVVKDLKNGDITTSVKELLFARLAEVQPISRSEMPAAYNANPNARLFYMLKSFTLKQLDIIRREVYRKAREGEVGEAAKNALILASLYSTLGLGVNAIKDAIRGKEIAPEGVADEAFWSLAGVLGVNKYMASDATRGNIGDAAASVVMPPFAWAETAYKIMDGTAEAAMGEGMEKFNKGVYRLPVIGAFYNFVNENFLEIDPVN